MRRETVDLLVCTDCGGPLLLQVHEWKEGEVVRGILNCTCGSSHPILKGIPRFIRTFNMEKRVKETVESFGFEWSRYRVRNEQENLRTFFRETLYSSEEIKGKLVLDAGRGSGRYSRAAAAVGARVFGFDASISVEKAKEMSGGFPVEYIQADLFNPPFRHGSFDYIFSLGVLHHTKSPLGVLRRLYPLLRSGGAISFWVYGRTGSFTEFKEAFPCRLKGFRLGLFLLLRIRELNSEIVRKITTNIPDKILYLLSYLSIPFGRIRIINAVLPVSTHPNPYVRVNDTFDWYAPKIQSHHTKREVFGWCQKVQLKVVGWISVGLVPKFGVRAEKRQS